MNIIFGTDGYRGLLDSEMNETSVTAIAQAFADYINNLIKPNNPLVIIGYDSRKFSVEFSQLFAEILSGNNINVLLSDKIIPTPVVSFSVKHYNATAAVVITASHNPAIYNGIKFKSNFGAPFFTEETKKVEALLFKSPAKKSTNLIKKIDLFEDYKKAVLKLIDTEKLKNSNLKLLVDSMGGAGCNYLSLILHNIIDVNTIFGIPSNNFYNRYAEPIEKNLLPLSTELNNGNYSLGVANDGDADRVGVMLDNGSWLSAQETILLIADYLINTKNLTGNLVKTSSVTDKLLINFSDKVKVYDVQVGFKYIAEKMIYDNIVFGCEESGGFGYGFHLPERDGLFSTLILLEMLSNSGFNKLSDYVLNKRKLFGNIYYDRIDYKYNKNDRIDILPNLLKDKPNYINGFLVKNINVFYSSRGIVNGIKFYLDGNPRWLLLRASETEPLVRIYAEAENTDEVNNLLNFGIKLING